MVIVLQPDVGCPATFLPALCVASAHEEPVRPGVKARRVAQLGEVSPDGQQRLLRRVLREVDVAQDAARHGQEPIGDLGGDQGVRPSVPALCSHDEIGVHGTSANGHRLGAVCASHGMGRRCTELCQSAQPATEKSRARLNRNAGGAGLSPAFGVLEKRFEPNATQGLPGLSGG